jgi:hypothetical protein
MICHAATASASAALLLLLLLLPWVQLLLLLVLLVLDLFSCIIMRWSVAVLLDERCPSTASCYALPTSCMGGFVGMAGKHTHTPGNQRWSPGST